MCLEKKAIWSRENLPVFNDDLSKDQVKAGRRKKNNQWLQMKVRTFKCLNSLHINIITSTGFFRGDKLLNTALQVDKQKRSPPRGVTIGKWQSEKKKPGGYSS